MRIPAHSVCTAIRDDIVAGVYERGSRLTEAYQERQKTLDDAVEAARKRVTDTR